jgi:TonB dependent receptor-like, beta-barrel
VSSVIHAGVIELSHPKTKTNISISAGSKLQSLYLGICDMKIKSAVAAIFARWGNSIAYTDTQTDSVRGFLDLADTPQPWTAKTNADLESFKQSLHLKELFFDSNLTTELSSRLDLTTGVNFLIGRANADSMRYGLRLLLDGLSQAPDIESGNPRGTVNLVDHRGFFGAYAQGRFHLTPNASLLAGLRWNSTRETREVTRVNSRGVVTQTPGDQDVNRVSGSLGGQWTPHGRTREGRSVR